MILEKLKAVVATMYDFHDSTDVFANSSFLPFLNPKAPNRSLRGDRYRGQN